MAYVRYEVCDRCGEKVSSDFMRFRKGYTLSTFALEAVNNISNSISRVFGFDNEIEVKSNKVLCCKCKHSFEEWLKNGNEVRD